MNGVARLRSQPISENILQCKEMHLPSSIDPLMAMYADRRAISASSWSHRYYISHML
jgi:hypothetical protein